MTQPRKTGRPRIEDRANTIEARKPWLKLELGAIRLVLVELQQRLVERHALLGDLSDEVRSAGELGLFLIVGRLLGLHPLRLDERFREPLRPTEHSISEQRRVFDDHPRLATDLVR
jgi:hypothetical protein